MHIFKKKFASVVKTGVLAVFTAGLLVSCQKESFNGGDKPLTNKITDQKMKDALVQAALNTPKLGFYNSAMDKVIVLDFSDPHAKTFSFVDPPSGISIITESDNGTVIITSSSSSSDFAESGGLVVITEFSAGFSMGGGTVVAGDLTLDIDFAYCFSAETGVEGGGGMFGADGFSNVAGAVGISGDFEALMSESFDPEDPDYDPFEFFEGFAYYFVFTDELGNESYEVIPFEEANSEGEEEDELEDVAFAWVVGFSGDDGGVYLSADGELSVNGGSIGFDGEYYCIEGLGFFNDEGEDEEPDASLVTGYGELGCDM